MAPSLPQVTLCGHLLRQGHLTEETEEPDTGLLILMVNLGFNELCSHQYLPERPPCRLTTEPRGTALPLQRLMRRWNLDFILMTHVGSDKTVFFKKLHS